MVKGALAVGVQDVLVVADGPGVERPVARLAGILAATSGANAGAWRVDLGFNPRVQGVVDHHWQHPVAQRRPAERPLRPLGRRDGDAPHRGGFPGGVRPAVIDPLGPLVGCGPQGPIDPGRVPSTVDLRDAPD
jgi:hypothetical protein